MRPPHPLILLLLALAGCGGRGVVLSGAGARDNTPSNARAHVSGLIARDLDARLGRQGRAEVTLAELPEWTPEGGRRSEGWHWKRATVQIDLVGAAEPPALDPDAVRAVLDARLRPAVIGGNRNLLVRISALADADRYAALAAADHRVAPRSTAGPAPELSERRYTVQRGDTLAEISAAFYGTPQHWRAILAANPGLDAGALRGGESLRIPALP
jgi:LysM repeat protein